MKPFAAGGYPMEWPSGKTRLVEVGRPEEQVLRVRVWSLVIAAALTIAAIPIWRSEALGSGGRGGATAEPRAPVLVELFTSEGCSDCPPADALLERLDRLQPVSSAEAIVLSEHVDYWNGLGWRDPYSLHALSERQNAYAAHFGLATVYTPQMVVDGRYEFVGSDAQRAFDAIERATQEEKVPVNLSSVRLEGGAVALHVETGPTPSAISAKRLDVLLAIADESDESHVSGGENGGRTLTHVSVLRTLAQVGETDSSGKFAKDVKVRFERQATSNLRVIALLQEPAGGRVWGVGETRLPE